MASFTSATAFLNAASDPRRPRPRHEAIGVPASRRKAGGGGAESTRRGGPGDAADDRPGIASMAFTTSAKAASSGAARALGTAATKAASQACSAPARSGWNSRAKNQMRTRSSIRPSVALSVVTPTRGGAAGGWAIRAGDIAAIASAGAIRITWRNTIMKSPQTAARPGRLRRWRGVLIEPASLSTREVNPNAGSIGVIGPKPHLPMQKRPKRVSSISSTPARPVTRSSAARV
jgi:hypothetical protein